MSLPTVFSVSMVSDLFFRHIKELSVRSLKELRYGNKQPELRLVRDFHVSTLGRYASAAADAGLQSTSTSKLFLRT